MSSGTIIASWFVDTRTCGSYKKDEPGGIGLKNTIWSLVAFGLVLASAGAHASITYDVNRAVGAGTVVGTIETDGTLGVLTVGNIDDFSLTVDVGIDMSAITLGGPGGTFEISGPPFNLFSASATELLFKFAADDFGFIESKGGGGVAGVWRRFFQSEPGEGGTEFIMHATLGGAQRERRPPIRRGSLSSVSRGCQNPAP